MAMYQNLKYTRCGFGRLLQLLDVVTDTKVLLKLASVVDRDGRMRHGLWVAIMVYSKAISGISARSGAGNRFEHCVIRPVSY